MAACHPNEASEPGYCKIDPEPDFEWWLPPAGGLGLFVSFITATIGVYKCFDCSDSSSVKVASCAILPGVAVVACTFTVLAIVGSFLITGRAVWLETKVLQMYPSDGSDDSLQKKVRRCFKGYESKGNDWRPTYWRTERFVWVVANIAQIVVAVTWCTGVQEWWEKAALLLFFFIAVNLFFAMRPIFFLKDVTFGAIVQQLELIETKIDIKVNLDDDIVFSADGKCATLTSSKGEQNKFDEELNNPQYWLGLIATVAAVKLWMDTVFGMPGGIIWAYCMSMRAAFIILGAVLAIASRDGVFDFIGYATFLLSSAVAIFEMKPAVISTMKCRELEEKAQKHRIHYPKMRPETIQAHEACLATLRDLRGIRFYGIVIDTNLASGLAVKLFVYAPAFYAAVRKYSGRAASTSGG